MSICAELPGDSRPLTLLNLATDPDNAIPLHLLAQPFVSHVFRVHHFVTDRAPAKYQKKDDHDGYPTVAAHSPTSSALMSLIIRDKASSTAARPCARTMRCNSR